ncbi:MAG TPA: hypothetical protein DCG47_07630 [Spirochaetaceae bacterium]|jgi:hypothetical protein|nr:hypothetical protein [Spirochaetaceae bacterium]
MSFLSFPPRLTRPSAERVELSLAPVARALYLGLGLVLILVLRATLEPGSPFILMFGIVIGLAALNEERWIFDRGRGELRRRFGILILAKSWAVDLAELASIELDSEAASLSASDPYNKVSMGIAKGSCALRLILADGKSLSMYILPNKHYKLLAEYGKTIAELLSKPFIES